MDKTDSRISKLIEIYYPESVASAKAPKLVINRNLLQEEEVIVQDSGSNKRIRSKNNDEPDVYMSVKRTRQPKVDSQYYHSPIGVKQRNVGYKDGYLTLPEKFRQVESASAQVAALATGLSPKLANRLRPRSVLMIKTLLKLGITQVLILCYFQILLLIRAYCIKGGDLFCLKRGQYPCSG